MVKVQPTWESILHEIAIQESYYFNDEKPNAAVKQVKILKVKILNVERICNGRPRHDEKIRKIFKSKVDYLSY